jgi:hypothetical protein
MWLFTTEWVVLYGLNLFWLKKLLFGAYKILTCTSKDEIEKVKNS